MVHRHDRREGSGVSAEPVRHQFGFQEGAGRLEVSSDAVRGEVGSSFRRTVIDCRSAFRRTGETVMRRCGLLTLVAVLLIAAPATAQVDFTGEWAPLYHEDRPERIPGPELGDY